MQVLNSEHMLPLVIKIGARNKKFAFVHRMLMVEAVDTTMGGIAQEEHDEVLENILQVLRLQIPMRYGNWLTAAQQPPTDLRDW